MRKICIINLKGGVAKTATTINLAAGLTRKGKNVLIVDLDPQSNIAASLEFETYKDVYDLLFENAEVKECAVRVGKNLDVIRSRDDLSKAEILMANVDEPEYLLSEKLDSITGYDYVLIDCPPSMGVLSMNAMLYANEAVIPASCDFLGIDALRKTAELITTINSDYDHQLAISKVVPTMYDPKHQLSHNIWLEMQNEFYINIADPIRFDVKLKECPLEKCSIITHAPKTKAAEDYWSLTNSVLRDEGRY